MKARRLSDVRDLVTSPEFQAWWKELVQLRAELSTVEARHDELLGQLTLQEFRAELAQKQAIDTLYKAGEHEDHAARLLVESEELENRSFPGVASFEEQRYRASEAWYRLGAAEKAVDDARAGKRNAEELQSADRKLSQFKDEYEKEEQRKARLWEEVERLWMRSAEVSLMTAEEKVLARKVRSKAEKAFGVAEERKKSTQAFKVEVDAAASVVEATRAKMERTQLAANDRFGCAVGTDFVYFRHKEDHRHAFAISLVEDLQSYNVEVKSLAVYSVDRTKGVGFLEPARAHPLSLEDGDRRFEEYFLKGRKGEVRTQSAAS